MQDRVIYSSFNHYSIEEVRRLDPAAETAYLFSDVIFEVEKYCCPSRSEGTASRPVACENGGFPHRLSAEWPCCAGIDCGTARRICAC